MSERKCQADKAELLHFVAQDKLGVMFVVGSIVQLFHANRLVDVHSWSATGMAAIPIAILFTMQHNHGNTMPTMLFDRRRASDRAIMKAFVAVTLRFVCTSQALGACRERLLSWAQLFRAFRRCFGGDPKVLWPLFKECSTAKS